MKKKILIVIGTRPEALKLCPLIMELKLHKHKYKTYVCSTGQHMEMLDEVFSFFKIKPDFELGLMNNSLNQIDLIAKAMVGIQKIIFKIKPDILFVQGDTNSCMAGSIAGFFNKIKVAHLEAGLRSDNMEHPWPEEANRKLVSEVTSFYFCPTQSNKEKLLKENIYKNVYVVGNTVIDSLKHTMKLLNLPKNKKFLQQKFNFLGDNKFILLTAHRRESHGKGVHEISKAIKFLASHYQETNFVIPLHPNPNVKKAFTKLLKGEKNIFLLKAQDYLSFNYLMKESLFIISDSGGVQEEAPTIKKKVILLRELTERQESVGENMKIAGLKSQNIIREAKIFIKNPAFVPMKNPYGNGNTSKKIVAILDKKLC